MTLDPQAVTFDELLAHSRFVRGLARSLVTDPHSADDAEQLAWMAALQRPPSARGNLRAWLGRVLRRRISNLRRAEMRRSAYEHGAPVADDFPSAEKLVVRAETRAIVARAVLSLEEPYRSTVLLRYLEEYSASEVAIHMGVPVSTVRTRLQRALGQLRDKLARDLSVDGADWRAGLLPLLISHTRAPLVGSAALTVGAVVMKIKALLIAASIGLVGLLLWHARVGPDPGETSISRDETAASEQADPDRGPALHGQLPQDAAQGGHEKAARGTPVAQQGSEPPGTSKPERTVVGIVVDADSGAAVPGAHVALLRVDSGRRGWVVRSRALGRAVCGEDGRFRITAAIPSSGVIDAVVRAPGYCKAGSTLRGDRVLMDLGRIELARSASVEGTVLANGVPAEDITVVAAPEGTPRGQRMDTAGSTLDMPGHDEAGLAVPLGAVAKTGHDGSFSLAGLPRDTRLVVRAGWGSARVEITRVLAPTKGLTIRLEGGASILVQVRGARAPAAWRLIAHYTPKVERGVPRPQSVMREFEVHRRRERRFWFAPGDVELNVMTLAGEAQLTTRLADLEAGEDRTVDWSYEELSAIARGSMRAMWARNVSKPAVVYLLGPSGDLLTRGTGMGARQATFGDLEPGSYEVVSASGASPPVTWARSEVTIFAGRESSVVLGPAASGVIELTPPGEKVWLVKLRRDERIWPFLFERAGAPNELVAVGRCRVRGRVRLHVLSGEYELTVREAGSDRTLFKRPLNCAEKKTVKVTAD